MRIEENARDILEPKFKISESKSLLALADHLLSQNQQYQTYHISNIGNIGQILFGILRIRYLKI